MDHRVTIISCQDYTQAAEQLALLIQRLGGIERYARPGETLLLKANLLAAAAPDQALSTHPAVVAAAAKLCAAQGAKAVIADSPGGPYLEAGMRRVYEKTGMAQAAAEITALDLITTCPPAKSPCRRARSSAVPRSSPRRPAATACGTCAR